MNTRNLQMQALILMSAFYSLGVAAKGESSKDAVGNGPIPDELKIKREAVFEFSEKPKVTRNGDLFTISFASKGFCDATVAIENGRGRIIRHLASGILGPKAPAPFQKNSRKQTLVWDGKNDKGQYVDNLTEVTVRVSLGLKPRYEKSLFWEPKKRVSAGGAGAAWTEDVLVSPAPEGVYVFDGNGVDHVRMFDHDGNYARTIYPFPAAKLKEVKGLEWKDYPHGYARPQKHGLNRTTFFNSGGTNTKQFALPAAFAMAVQGDRIALAKLCLSRLKTDGSTGGFNLTGPKTWFDMVKGKPWKGSLHSDSRCCPYSAAFSPDGKKLYLAGFSNFGRWRGGGGAKIWLGGVACLDYEGNEPAKIFMGDMNKNSGLTPGVACDSQGRVYVTDFIRDAVDVFNAEGKRLKSVAVKKPVFVSVSPKTGELYVFSWHLNGTIWATHPGLKGKSNKVPPKLTVFRSADDPKPVATYDLPRVLRSGGYGGWGDPNGGTDVRASVDFWTDPPTVWLVPGGGSGWRGYGEGNRLDFDFRKAWDKSNITLFQAKGGKLELKRDFGKDIAQSVKRHKSNKGHRRLYVNPENENLYVTESEHWVGGGSFHNLLQIDPVSGSIGEVPLPAKWVEDMAFDIDGNAYLRQVEPQHQILRYDSKTWREIPWDYGEESTDGNKPVISALRLPAWGAVCYSEGGLYVSPKGHLAVSCSTKDLSNSLANLKRVGSPVSSGVPYQPPIYPGRSMSPITGCVHIWDKHGQLLHKDAVPGMSQIDGLGLDKDANLYLMSAGTRVWNKKRHFNFISGTLVKLKAGQSKWRSDSSAASVPMSKESLPKRSSDIAAYTQGNLWIEGAEWFYGGVGNCSFKIASGCICWQQSRFTLDYFARSFAPENDQFSVAVLDSSGSLITRIGRYGNVDDGRPLSKDKRWISPAAKSIGGDEVSLMHPSHVATMTDRYLYIGDVGNARIVQVKLGYHAQEKVALKEMQDQKQ